MFWGYFPLSGSSVQGAWGLVASENPSTHVPTQADALPTFRVYGADSDIPKATGTSESFDPGNLTGVYKVSFTVTGAFERGLNYQVVIDYAVSGTPQQEIATFSVY